MNPRLSCNDELDLDTRFESRGDTVAAGRPKACSPSYVDLSAPGIRRNGSRNAERRYVRFEPVTVRAAARVLRLQRTGVVSAREARFYLRELAAMDAHAGAGAYRSLLRAARRCPSLRRVTWETADANRSVATCEAKPRYRRGANPLRGLHAYGTGTATRH